MCGVRGRHLENLVTMEEAVAMDILIVNDYPRDGCLCYCSMYHPNNTSLRAARKERLRLSAISTPATVDSDWLGNEPYDALYKHGQKSRSEFTLRIHDYRFPKSLVDTYAHSVQCLRVNIDDSVKEKGFVHVKKFLSLDAWKEAFPSLRRVYLVTRRWNFDLSPHLLKHLRGLKVDDRRRRLATFTM